MLADEPSVEYLRLSVLKRFSVTKLSMTIVVTTMPARVSNFFIVLHYMKEDLSL